MRDVHLDNPSITKQKVNNGFSLSVTLMHCSLMHHLSQLVLVAEGRTVIISHLSRLDWSKIAQSRAVGYRAQITCMRKEP